MNNGQTETESADILVEFLEVAVHIILHARQLYPAAIFERRRKYGIPVQASIHPQLNEYIEQCLKTTHLLIRNNELKKFVICIFDAKKRPSQRIIFDILRISSARNSEDPFYITVEASLRCFCLRIAAAEGFLKRVTPGSSFTIQLHTTENARINLDQEASLQDFPWFEIPPNGINTKIPEIIPIHKIDMDSMQLDIYAEEPAQN